MVFVKLLEPGTIDWQVTSKDYKPFQYAESIFWGDKFGVKVFLLVYVDDIMLISSSHDQAEIQSVKDEISNLYKIKDLGKAV